MLDLANMNFPLHHKILQDRLSIKAQVGHAARSRAQTSKGMDGEEIQILE